MTKPAELLAVQQERGDRLAVVAERLAAAAGTFLDDHANPAPGEACFAAHGTTDLTAALAELPAVLREWRTWKWDATAGASRRVSAADTLAGHGWRPALTPDEANTAAWTPEGPE